MVSHFSSDKLSVKQLSCIQLFTGFDQEDFKTLSNIIRVKEFEKGSCIINEGDNAQKVYFILEGAAKVYKTNYKGKGELVGNLQDGHCFGEMAFMDHGHRSATVVADTDIVVAEFDWNDFCSAFMEKPLIVVQIFKNFAHNLSLRLRRANAVYSYLAYNSQNIP